jgi:hypothetical protein
VVHDVPFEAASLMGDYDALDTHDFIVAADDPTSDVPIVAADQKFFVGRQFGGEGEEAAAPGIDKFAAVDLQPEQPPAPAILPHDEHVSK